MKKLYLSIFASSLLLANENPQISSLKEQMLQMQNQMNALQEKLKSYEENSKKEILAPYCDHSDAHTEHSSIATKENSHNNHDEHNHHESMMPNIGMVIDSSYVSRNINDSKIAHLEIPAIAHGVFGSHSHDGHSHSMINENEGFSFNYAEMNIGSNIKNIFDLSSTLHISNDSIEVEEAYFKTDKLLQNTTLKGGKFLSNFGLLNNKHHHEWEFSDAPMIYRAFLGSHGINEIGAQIEYKFPLEGIDVRAGFEALQGDNEESFGTSAIAPVGDSETIYADKPSQPSLYVGYLKASHDIDFTTISGGLSYADGNSRIDHLSDELPHAFSGDTKLYNAHFSTQTYFDKDNYLLWENELTYRDMSGNRYVYPAGDDTTLNVANLDKENSGYYTQLIYAFDDTWSVGSRYENIYKNEVNSLKQTGDLDGYAFKIDYRIDHLALFRVQYNKNNFMYNEEGMKENLDEIIFQLNFAIGAHKH